MANFTTPNATDLYSRFMVGGFDEREFIGVPTGMQAYFGNPANGSRTIFSNSSLLIDIDILRGNEKLAKMIQRGANSRPLSLQLNTNEQKFSTFSRLYPLIEEEGGINASELNNRILNENSFQGMTKLDRMRELAMNIHLEHIRRILRTNEFLASQSMILGTMPAIIGTSNPDLVYDFLRNSDNNITVGTAWTDPAAVIFANIDDGCDQIRENGHVTPDMILVGGDAMDAYIKDSEVQAVSDNRRIDLIEVSLGNPVPAKFNRFIASGFEARGRIRTPKGRTLWMFTYSDIYENDAGTAVNFMPLDKAIISFSGARLDRYFGPDEVLPKTTSTIQDYRDMFGFDPTVPPMPLNVKNMGDIVNPSMFYSDAYRSSDNKKVTLRTQSAPIFATTMTDTIAVLSGLT